MIIPTGSRAGTSRQRASRCFHPCGLSRASGMDRRLVCATESFAANCRGTRQHYQSHRGGRIGERRCSDCPTAQWSCKSPIENSPSSTSAPAARGWDRLSQEIPLKDNGQLYRGCQARESGLTISNPSIFCTDAPFVSVAKQRCFSFAVSAWREWFFHC